MIKNYFKRLCFAFLMVNGFCCVLRRKYPRQNLILVLILAMIISSPIIPKQKLILKNLPQTSKRVKLVDIGKTEEGRSQYMLIVSSPENLKKSRSI